MKKVNLQNLIRSINREVEEKTQQMSQIRLVAEAMARGLHQGDYLNRVCGEMVEIFTASACALLKFRHRHPAGWFLDYLTGKSQTYQSTQKWLPQEEEGALGWVRIKRRPCFIQKIGAESFSNILGEQSFNQFSAVLIPLIDDNMTKAVLGLINPIFNPSPENLKPQLEVLSRLINSGYGNHLLYKELQKSEEEYRDIFENSSDIVVVTHPDGVIKDCNQTFIRILRTKGEVLGRKITDFISEDSSKAFTQWWSRLREKREISNEDVYLVCEDGSIIEAELSGNAKVLANGKTGLIRLYFRDVTQRREAERRQRELELELELAHQRHLAQIGFYVSGIAHNLRNPLHIISNYIEAVRIKGQAMPELTRMKQATESMISIIDNLLTKLRKESNLRAVEVNLNDLLKSELEFLNADLFFKNEIQKHYSFCEDLPLVKGLYGDFSQALMNIVYNALDALRDCEKKKLEIKTWYLQEKGTICISISDSGKGILEKDQHKIFQPFFSTKKVEGENNLGISSGSGLGLSNSLALLKPYGGEIEFHSKAGEGTTFIISIPSIKQGTH